MNPTSEAAAKNERAWNAYYEKFETPELKRQLKAVIRQQFRNDDLDLEADRERVGEAVTAFIRALPSSGILALARGIEIDIPTFEEWNEERP